LEVLKGVSAKTPKYCPRCKCLFHGITITELRFVNPVSNSYDCRERFPLTYKKKSVKELNAELTAYSSAALQLSYPSTSQTVQKRIHKQVLYHM